MARRKISHIDVQQHTLGDVTIAQRTRQAAVDLYLDNAKPQTPDLKYYVFKLADKFKRGGYNLGSICDIRVKNGDGSYRTKRIRLLRGVSTIWAEEQKDLTPDYIKQNHISPRFEKGVLRVSETDSLMLEFLRLHGANINSDTTLTPQKTLFYEWDSEAIAKQESELRGKRRKALKVASEQPLDKVRKHALHFGISFTDEVTGEPKTEGQLRNDYEDYADLNAENFLSLVDSAEVEVSYLVRTAIKEGFIELGRQPNTAFFSTGALICKIPPNTRPVQALIDFALQKSDDGRAFLETLQSKATK